MLLSEDPRPIDLRAVAASGVRPLHVAQVGLVEDARGRTPERLLEDWPTLVDVADCASTAGMRVSVIQACPHVRSIRRNGVDFHFLPRRARRMWRAPVALPRGPSGAWSGMIRGLAPDVIHVHGLDFPRETLELAALAPGVPIVLQDHASRPPRPWRRAGWRRGWSAVAGVAFCAREQAEPFAAAGLLAGATVYEIPESTSRFTAGDRLGARRVTSLAGDPAALWVGHLDRNKDPLTVLEGIARATRALPNLTLHCCFGKTDLLRAVRARIASDPRLRGRVHLLGRVPHERVELLMRAADLFVLGSHREGSGYALIEALACGLPPVVTDIPSFRALTRAGAVGALWPRGNPQALADALIAVAARRGDELRAAVRAHFERDLSMSAVGAKLAHMYRDLRDRARSGAASGAA